LLGVIVFSEYPLRNTTERQEMFECTWRNCEILCHPKARLCIKILGLLNDPAKVLYTIKRAGQRY